MQLVIFRIGFQIGLQIGVALHNGYLLCSQGTFRHSHMPSNGNAEFPGQFPKVRLSLWRKWPATKFTNRRSYRFNLSVG